MEGVEENAKEATAGANDDEEGQLREPLPIAQRGDALEAQHPILPPARCLFINTCKGRIPVYLT